MLLVQARIDMRQAVNYLRKENPTAASSLILALQKSLRLIEKNPNIGRPDPEDATREWSIPNWPYVIPYRIKGDNIEILRVWHTRRDRPDIWS